jgi:hypothetical protein
MASKAQPEVIDVLTPARRQELASRAIDIAWAFQFSHPGLAELMRVCAKVLRSR